MTKKYKIFLLIILFILFTTFNPQKLQDNTILKDTRFFDITKIVVINNYLVPEEEIKFRLKNLYKKNIFSIKMLDIEKSLSSIDFLNKVKVKKKYPNTIKIFIYEENPVGVLNKKGKKFFVCESSKLIPFISNILFKDLPNIFGDAEGKTYVNFLEQLASNQFPIEKIKNFYFFKIGRWDLELINKQTIKLPFTNIEESIKQSIILLNRKDFEKFKIIDLRINGKIITEQ